MYETDWRRASAGAPGCVAVREWREFEDAEDVADVVDMRDDAESLPLTLVCGVGSESTGEADIMKAGGNTGNVSCTVVMGLVSRIIRERGRSPRSRKRAKHTQPNSPNSDEGVSHTGTRYAK